MVALLLTSLFGFMGLVIDVGWFQVNLARIQRAADAAALAGTVYLPGNVPGAINAAKNAAAQNNYVDGVGGVTVTAAQDSLNPDLLRADVAAPVSMFFLRLFGVSTVNGHRNARAEFILPVQMGSPQDYLGIYQLRQTDGTAVPVGSAPNAGTGPALASQGFWAAVISMGGNSNNGDAYSTTHHGGGTNPQYDPAGYYYMVSLPAGTTNGEVWLFDPSFCAVGHGSSGVYLGTGDHWIGAGGGTAMTTTYRLWDPHGTPYSIGNDTLIVDTGNTFALQNQVDMGPLYGGDGRYGDSGYNGSSSADCQNDPYHNQWYKLAGGLVAGFYHLQVTTSSSDNINVNAENMFGIEAITNGPPGAAVYGLSRMCAYNNVPSGTSTFYLARVPATLAGKTLQIQLFDPGDTGGDAFIRVKQPTPTGYVNAMFSYTANGGAGSQSGTNVTQIQTSVSGREQYDGSWVTITIPLPVTYGSGGLTPPGETQPGWWKIEYQITSTGNDTITYQVGIRGNPVHLVTP